MTTTASSAEAAAAAAACPQIYSEALFLEPDQNGPRNIPKVKFIENIADFAKDRDVTALIRTLHQLHSKYQFMDRSLSSQKKSLLTKLPGISEAIDSVSTIKEHTKGPIDTHFVLSESFYGKGRIAPTESVFLWLGANVLMEYPLDDAIKMLEDNRKNAETAIQELSCGLEFLRTQLTATEINIARFHNYGVGQRRLRRGLESSSQAVEADTVA